MHKRLTPFKTVSHEWWHVMRTDMKNKPFTPFEEGGADLFSESIIRDKTSATSDLDHAYGPLKDAVGLLRDRFGEDWLLNSRSAPDGKKYLRETFEKAGFPKDKIDRVLSNEYRVDSDVSCTDWCTLMTNSPVDYFGESGMLQLPMLRKVRDGHYLTQSSESFIDLTKHQTYD
jgi:hypothetical protein